MPLRNIGSSLPFLEISGPPLSPEHESFPNNQKPYFYWNVVEGGEIITSIHTKYSNILPPTLFTSSTKMPYWMYVFENVIFGFAFFYGNRRQNKLLHDVWMGTDGFKISMISCITTRSSPSSNQQLPIMGQLRMFANRIMVEYFRRLGDN